jgi:Ca2+-transporting ATPase
VANAWRGGEKKQVKTCDLVPGDIIEVKEGELVPADIRLIKPINMKIDKYSLTVRISIKEFLGRS